jgi:hypothetical protein
MSGITSKSATQPTIGNWCQSNEDFDLDLNDVIVGAVDANKNITSRKIKAKPAEVLAAKLKEASALNSVLGQQITSLLLSSAQKDTQITQLGQQVAALTLAAAKGGTAS